MINEYLVKSHEYFNIYYVGPLVREKTAELDVRVD